jgi:hypothetical protein
MLALHRTHERSTLTARERDKLGVHTRTAAAARFLGFDDG